MLLNGDVCIMPRRTYSHSRNYLAQILIYACLSPSLDDHLNQDKQHGLLHGSCCHFKKIKIKPFPFFTIEKHTTYHILSGGLCVLQGTGSCVEACIYSPKISKPREKMGLNKSAQSDLSQKTTDPYRSQGRSSFVPVREAKHANLQKKSSLEFHINTMGMQKVSMEVSNVK